ncbi:hypothetical protein [Legionella oakridgensis]|nr:hypothetical protein [Legionella oakridgensis]KTD43751.1 hypothetical protein Loak_0301 [Legionella oakridgensis]STY15828.1 Uncharacterised protein [Legionella longbeachae]
MMRMFGIGRNPTAILLRTNVSLTSLSRLSKMPVVVEAKTPTGVFEHRAFTTSITQVPSPQFFEKLKAEEHRQFTRKKRARFDYSDNHSAALALPYSQQELERKQDDQQALLAMSKKNVIEHANRRVDLFFYTLIAYYKTGIVPTSGHTNLQHGKGRHASTQRTITEACHSSLIPSLLDKTIYERGGKRRKSLICNTHFMDSLNSTVELPSFVNDFDDLLESACRESCLKILDDVSVGIINPIEGLSAFLNMMQNILNNFKRQAERENHSAVTRHSLLGSRGINLKMIDLVMHGTLSTTFSTETKAASDDYIQLMLRITPEEKALCVTDKRMEDQLYLEKITVIQDEILQAKSMRSSPAGT